MAGKNPKFICHVCERKVGSRLDERYDIYRLAWHKGEYKFTCAGSGQIAELLGDDSYERYDYDF